mgnify:CR=1 FL=1
MLLALVNIRMDEVLKKDVPLDVSVDPFYSECNTERIKESTAQFKEGQTATKTMEQLFKIIAV